MKMTEKHKPYLAAGAVLILAFFGARAIYLKSSFLNQRFIEKRMQEAKEGYENSQEKYQQEIQKFADKKDRNREEAFRLAEAYMNIGNLELAKERAFEVIANDSGYVNGYLILGNILREQGKYDEAEQSFRQILAIDPKHSDAYGYIAAMYYIYKEDAAGARIVLQEGLAADPKNDTLKEMLKAYNK